MATERTSNGKLTYADYCLIPSDGRRFEVVDGVLFVNPAPRTSHQAVSKRLLVELYRQIEESGLGLVFNAPFDVELGKHDIVQPDLVVLLEPNLRVLKPTRVIGVPDLVVEILSPSNTAYDLKTKRRRYELAGVREYWIVDPDGQTLKQLVLRNGRYSTQRSSAILRPTVCEGVAIEVAKLW